MKIALKENPRQKKEFAQNVLWGIIAQRNYKSAQSAQLEHLEQKTENHAK